MLQLTDTQLLILSAPSQRDDRGVELPTNVRGGAARKVVDKLVRAGLLEQIRASGSLPIWQRDEQRGPIALRITKDGLAAIDVEGGAAVLDAGAVLAQNRTSLRNARVFERTAVPSQSWWRFSAPLLDLRIPCSQPRLAGT
jgi:hypothetical protein